MSPSDGNTDAVTVVAGASVRNVEVNSARARLGPATVAAYTLARRHACGESFPVWSAFAAAWRREFVRGSIVVLSLTAVAALLLYAYFVSSARDAFEGR